MPIYKKRLQSVHYYVLLYENFGISMKITSVDITQLLSYVFKHDESYAGHYTRFCRYFGVNEGIFSIILHEYFRIISAITPGSTPESLFTADTILRLLRVAAYDQNNESADSETVSGKCSGSGGALVGRQLITGS